MKRSLILLVVLAAAFLAGCQQNRSFCITPCSGVVDSREDRLRRFCNISDLQARMLVDDSDYFWLVERPSYLSYWYVREAE